MTGAGLANDVFETTERRFAEACGVQISTHMLEIDAPVRRVRTVEAGDGAPLLLVHGGGGLALHWFPLMARLTGRRLIAVDRPGCGLTDGFTYRRNTDVRAHATTFLAHVLDALEIDALDVVANSMGGLWSLWLALDQPERVRSLALLGCPALILDTSAPVAMRLISRKGFSRLMRQRTTPDGYGSLMKRMGHPEDLAVHLPDGFAEASSRGSNLPGAADSFISLLQRCIRLRGARPDVALGVDELTNIGVPTSIIWGSNDPFGGRDVAEGLAATTGASLSFEGIGHLPWLDAPEKIADVIACHLSAVSGRAELI